MTVTPNEITLLKSLIEWLDQGYQVTLATVVKTWGSAPRPIGSMMAIRQDGIHLGSVSGGCIEADLLSHYSQQIRADDFPKLLQYGIDTAQARTSGLPCGGQLELIIEQPESAQPFKLILKRLETNQLSTRKLCLNTGEISIHPASGYDCFVYDQHYLKQVFGPSWHILLIGAGHLSHFVAQIAIMMDYRVTICDPREEYAKNWQLTQTEYTPLMPDEAVNTLVNHQRGIVITLTHDPKLDDMALMEALQHPLCYIGALGSQKTNAARRLRLAQLGLTESQIKKLHGPAGLSIGSKTPAEIAVAIMAGITATRHQLLNHVC